MAHSSSKRSRSKRAAFEPPVIDAELLQPILEDLNIPKSKDWARIGHRLAAHVSSFAFARYMEGNVPTIHEDAQLAREMVDLIERLRDRASQLSPLISALLDMSYSELADRTGARAKLFDDLETYKEMISRFGKASFSRKRRDEVLRNAIGGLMLYLELLTGNRATVQRARSDFGKAPSLSSPEARAIGRLLRIVQPDLADTTIVNRVEEIRRTNRGQSLEEFSHQLFLGGTITPF